jgi:hypothetical protein
MRLFCPLDLTRAGDEAVYGWLISNGTVANDVSPTCDLFITGGKPAKNVASVPAPRRLGRITALSAGDRKGSMIELHRLHCGLELEAFSASKKTPSPIVIYYKCNRALASSPLGSRLDSAPLRWVSGTVPETALLTPCSG